MSIQVKLLCPKNKKVKGRGEEGRLRQAKQRSASISWVSMKGEST